ncbi:hypothetical protein KP509_18G044000 [Ceratopteris richardii]|uniref:Pentatricopeptide repeat-containing protein n=1 Tax=Ceratopteris richardii TaxID=49495 RepID=A0A8T2SR71_CERRI|nr:hypothetical protein KP509_18G044000 [Ceratopteris richardii]KAH7365745.1 hypothetical protein KP509_18G044000 [Ceratopteris richardii]KAH7365748.1 hypothetical protein KP509_18G044000 [Ceratopteris richardii]KAH7365749.1 hypothetical protein KP509_18G044000 [Ceratopteris richardii]
MSLCHRIAGPFSSFHWSSILEAEEQHFLGSTIRPNSVHSSPFILKVKCASKLPFEVSKSAYRLENQGIHVTPKLLHRLKKKEVWKNRRRQWKEREKTERVVHPVWYDWPDEQAETERIRLQSAESGEDEVDEFLHLVDEEHPAERVFAHVVNENVVNVSRRSAASSKSRGLKMLQQGSRKKCKKPGNGTRNFFTMRKHSSAFDKQADINASVALIHHVTSAAECVISSSILDTENIELEENFAPETGYVCSPNLTYTKYESLEELREHQTFRLKDSEQPGPPQIGLDDESNLSNDGIVGDIENSEPEGTKLDSTEEENSQNLAGTMTDYKMDLRKTVVSETPDLNYHNNVTVPRGRMNFYSADHHSHEETEPDKIESDRIIRNIDDNSFNRNRDTARCRDNSLPFTKVNVYPDRNDRDRLMNAAEISCVPTSTHESLNVQNSCPGTFQTSPLLRELYKPRKEPCSQIEKFLDDEIEKAPRGPEIWRQGVGVVKQRKPAFSKDIKNQILAQRRGDWSVLHESEDMKDDESDSSSSIFDGRRALMEDKKIQRLAFRLNNINYWTSKVHFSRLMHSGRMKLTEDRVLRLVQILGENGNWRRAMQVVQWVHKRQHYQFHASKFILTTLLSVLGQARRPVEALNVFNIMREKFDSYPDMAAYHTIACLLGQSGQLKELLDLIESLKVGPPKPIKFIPLINWDPSLYPDIIVYNSVITACISTGDWKGITWVWQQIEEMAIKPNGATFGLTIEGMAKANQFNQVARFYRRMERAGFPPNAQTYKSLVQAFGKENLLQESIELVKEMERSGIVGSAAVYFSLACNLCAAGKIKEALVQVRKINDMPSKKSETITYTGLIRACHKAGRIQDAIFLFKHMQHTCAPNVRTCNEMIKVYGWNNMFQEAKKVFEGIRKGKLESCLVFNDATSLSCDSFTYELMLKAAAISDQWAYFDEIYWDMISHGYYLRGEMNQWLFLKAARCKKVIHLLFYASFN